MSTILPNGNCVEVEVTSDNSAVIASCNTTITGGAGGVSDGDKGDITVSGSGATWTIDNGAVTATKIANGAVSLTKIANISSGRLLGNASGVSAGPAALEVASPLVLNTGTGKLEIANVVADTTTLTAGTGLTGGGDLTANRTFTVDFAASGVSSATKAVRADDSRLSDARTPTSHTHAASDIASGTIATARLGTGTAGAGNFLRGDQTWSTVTATFDPATKAECFSDFLGASAVPWTALTNGTGASTNFNTASDADHPGLITLSAGTVATGRAGVGSNLQDVYVLGSRATSMSTAITLVTNLSTATERYIFEAGFMDGLAGPANGVYFRYSDDINAGKWECVCIDAGGTTTADSGITVAAATFYRLEIDVNAAGTSAVFKIDGTTVATITTNIPTGTGERVGLVVQQRKTVGTTQRQSRCDYLYYTSAVSR